MNLESCGELNGRRTACLLLDGFDLDGDGCMGMNDGDRRPF